MLMTTENSVYLDCIPNSYQWFYRWKGVGRYLSIMLLKVTVSVFDVFYVNEERIK